MKAVRGFAKPQRRKRQRRALHLHIDRTAPGQVFRVYFDANTAHHCEVRLAPDKRRMHDAVRYHDDRRKQWEPDLEGMVRTWHAPRRRCAGVTRTGRLIVARMFLNARDLRRRPSEIVAHEATHAAMGWARLQRANLAVMPGEEVVAYAVGRLVKQINWHLFARGVFTR